MQFKRIYSMILYLTLIIIIIIIIITIITIIVLIIKQNKGILTIGHEGLLGMSTQGSTCIRIQGSRKM